MDIEEVHVVDGWRYLGTARSEVDVHDLLDQASAAQFDRDTYKLIRSHLGKGKLKLRHL